MAQWTGLPVINAGDGQHEHPTQGLLDMLTIRRHKGGFEGKLLRLHLVPAGLVAPLGEVEVGVRARG